MSYQQDSPDPAERLMATLGKWFMRVGLVVVLLGAVLGAVYQDWPKFAVAMFGIVAFIFARVVSRRQART